METLLLPIVGQSVLQEGIPSFLGEQSPGALPAGGNQAPGTFVAVLAQKNSLLNHDVQQNVSDGVPARFQGDPQEREQKSGLPLTGGEAGIFQELRVPLEKVSSGIQFREDLILPSDTINVEGDAEIFLALEKSPGSVNPFLESSGKNPNGSVLPKGVQENLHLVSGKAVPQVAKDEFPNGSIIRQPAGEDFQQAPGEKMRNAGHPILDRGLLLDSKRGEGGPLPSDSQISRSLESVSQSSSQVLPRDPHAFGRLSHGPNLPIAEGETAGSGQSPSNFFDGQKRFEGGLEGQGNFKQFHRQNEGDQTFSGGRQGLLTNLAVPPPVSDSQLQNTSIFQKEVGATLPQSPSSDRLPGFMPNTPQRLQMEMTLPDTTKVQIDVTVNQRQVAANLLIDHTSLRNMLLQHQPQLEHQLSSVGLELRQFGAETGDRSAFSRGEFSQSQDEAPGILQHIDPSGKSITGESTPNLLLETGIHYVV